MNRYKTQENGFVILLVMWVLVLLIALGTEFAFSMRTEINTTRNYKEDVASYYLAKAGINLAMAEILQTAKYHSWTEEAGYIIGKPLAEGNEDDLEIAQVEPVNRKNIALGNGSFTYTIQDENGKINLNTASRDIIVKALKANGLEFGTQRDTIADAILDWIDKDDNHRVNGAESDYYQAQSPPYDAKNGPFDSLHELLLIRGMSEQILYGKSDDAENSFESASVPGLATMFTVQNVPGINPNTAKPAVLSLFYSDIQADEIEQAKNDRGYFDDTLSTHFRVEATGTINNSQTQHTIVAIFEKQGNDEKTILITRYWNDNALGR